MVASSNCHSAPAPGVYLCQVNATTACGACCGLYNVADNSRQGLERLLQERTIRFTAVPRDMGSLDAFADWSMAQAGPGPMADFHHCAYLGLITDDLIGEKRYRVGCLLHPMGTGNQGVDLRGLSYYGSFTCRTYFCQASRNLPARFQHLLRAVFHHWYAYGLLATETRLVSLLLSAVEDRMGHRIDPAALCYHPDARQALRQLLTFKIDWRYRNSQQGARVHYLFKDGAHVRPTFSSNLVVEATDILYASVFEELVSVFDSPNQEIEARRLLDSAVEEAVSALSNTRFQHPSKETPSHANA